MEIVRKILIFFAISVSVNWLSRVLESSYPAKFLEEKIVELLITLLAINTATAGILVSKIDDLTKRFKIDFTNSVREIKNSILMQIWLIGGAAFILMLTHSKLVERLFLASYKNISDIALLTIFIAAIDILRDTGLAIFAIYEAIKNIDNSNRQ